MSEEKTSMIVAYRNNDLFQEYMPLVVGELERQGYEVEQIVFPKGTPEESISEKVSEMGDRFKTTRALIDNTVLRQVNYKHEERFAKKSPYGITDLWKIIDLDRLFEIACLRNIYGDSWKDYKALLNPEDQGEEGVESFKSGLGALVRKLQGETPFEGVVYVDSNLLLDHGPFIDIPGYDYNRQPSFENYVKALEIIREGLSRGGIPEERVKLVEHHSLDFPYIPGESPQDTRFRQNEYFREVGIMTEDEASSAARDANYECWTISDRHAVKRYNDYGALSFGKLNLELPLATMYHELKTQGLIQFDNLEDSIRTVIEAEFGTVAGELK